MTLEEYLLNSSPAVVKLETIEINHPAFSKTYYLVRNAHNGITATIEGGAVKQFEYYPFEIVKATESGDMDQSYTVNFGDLGELLPIELDRVDALGLVDSEISVTYRQYISDDLTQQLGNPISLKCKQFNFSAEGCQFPIEPKNIKDGKLGETYNLNRFPMLRAFL